jgi:DNA-binding LytR/AlgR family response regulator
VIFTTAYPNYAVEGFEVNAIDYLVKPISMDRFMKAVNKAVEMISLKEQKGEAPASGTIEQAEEENSDFIYVKADKKLIKIKYDEIYYIEGLKDYVIIKRKDDRIVTLQTMKSLDKKLPANMFQRIHRSYIVALNKINAIVGNQVEMHIDGKRKTIPIGKIYRDELLEIVNQNRL